jgi:serine/threonine protein kinase
MQKCAKTLESIFYNHETKQYRQPPKSLLVATGIFALTALWALRRMEAHEMPAFQARKLLSLDTPLKESPTALLNRVNMQASILKGRNVIPETELATFLDPNLPITENFTKVETLGSGAFGQVGLWQNKQGQQFAIKELYSSPSSETKNEFAIGLALDHPNIVKMHNAVTKMGDQGLRNYIVMEYIDGTTMGDFAGKHQITDELKLHFADQAIDAFDHMMDRKILPADLHFWNIMVTKDRQWKFVDLGFYTQLEVGHAQRWHLEGTGGLVQRLLRGSSYHRRSIPTAEFNQFRAALKGLHALIRHARFGSPATS